MNHFSKIVQSGKKSIIRAKLMYRSGKETVKKYFIIEYLDLFVFTPQLA